MAIDRFIEQRRPAWEELSRIVEEVYQRGPKRVQPQALEDMVYLYRQVSADLAHLRTNEADPALVTRINRLVTRAHGQIYRGKARTWPSVLGFFLVEYPRLFRQTFRFTLASFLLCAVVYAMAYQAVQDDPLLVADIMGGMDAEFIGDKEAKDITERFAQGIEEMGGGLMSSAITTNNIRVALMAFALGITLGIGTVWVLTVNAAMVGGIAGAFGRSGIESTLWATLLPHGALELTAIVIAGGSGLLLGWSIWCPGWRTRRRAVQEQSILAVKLVLGLVPAFIVAGTIEGFITGNEAIPQAVKVGIGVGALALFVIYLAIGGREKIVRAGGVA